MVGIMVWVSEFWIVVKKNAWILCELVLKG